jgi:hypothetical protein
MKYISGDLIVFLICAFICVGVFYFVLDDKTNITTKYELVTLSGDTFDMDVNVLITDDTAFAAKYVRDNLDSTVTSADFDARAVSFSTIDGKPPIIWMASTEDQGVIAHEIFHTALNVMYWTGMELNSETEEAFAYEVQYLTNSFYNQVNIIK